MEGKGSCPVCGRNFAVSEIQAHVEKCLFLNSSEPDASNSSYVPNKSPNNFLSCKRPSGRSSSTTPKRTKREPSIVSDSKNESDHRDPGLITSVNNSQVDDRPLAEKMRPASLDLYVGQNKVLGEGTVLRNLLSQDTIPSMILWGPPGCGKTTLAHIIHNQCRSTGKSRFVKLSATHAGVNDVKEMVKAAQNELKMFKKKTILFMDEIHRFNKLQQDIFLPCVETGVITLIGATTENPSFSLNSALLSRCRVFVLEKLKSDEIETLLHRAAATLNVTIESANNSDPSSQSHYTVNDDALKWLSDMCDGDARIALNSFHMALDSLRTRPKPVRISLADIEEGVKRSHLLYDRKGEEHYNIISALHKSIRASDDNAALYWLTRMLEGGEDPLFVARRLVRAASEDIGLADPAALGYAVAAMQGCQLIGMPECDVLLAQTAVYLARAEKSQEVYRALGRAKDAIKNHEGPLPSVPLHLRNAPTKLMRDLGYAKGYNMKHKDESKLQYMPDGLESVSFF